MTAPTRLICAPWCSLPDLPSPRPILVKDDPAADDDAWESIAWQASEMLYSLSARQFTGPCESTVEVREHRAGWRGTVAEAAFGTPLPTPMTVSGLPARVDGRRGARVVALPGRPVTEILEVALNGEPAPDGFAEADLSAGLLWRRDGRAWPVDGSVTVTYRHGVMPDIGGVAAAKALTMELGKAARVDGGNAGSFPKRLQSISREGLTVSYASTFESLEKGRTGIWEVDSWLSATNRHGFSAVPSVYSPDAARARRKVIP